MFERRKCCLSCKMLIDSALCGCSENRVFAPNIFLAQKKRVVFTIVCWHFFGAPDKPCGVGRADANPKLLLNDT